MLVEAGNRIISGGMHFVASPDDLPLELQRFVKTPRDSRGEPWLCHPFLVSPFPIKTTVPLGSFLDDRRGVYAKSLEKGDWKQAIMSVCRLWRISALREIGAIVDKSSDEQCEKFWRLSAWVWLDTEASALDPVWAEILRIEVPRREFFMLEEEKAGLEALGDEVTIYRGVHVPPGEKVEDHFQSHSWSTCKDVAFWLSQRLCPHGHASWVYEAKVSKKDIMAYLTRNGEAEVIVSPDAPVVQSCEYIAEVSYKEAAKFSI